VHVIDGSWRWSLRWWLDAFSIHPCALAPSADLLPRYLMGEEIPAAEAAEALGQRLDDLREHEQIGEAPVTRFIEAGEFHAAEYALSGCVDQRRRTALAPRIRRDEADRERQLHAERIELDALLEELRRPGISDDVLARLCVRSSVSLLMLDRELIRLHQILKRSARLSRLKLMM